jgi:hypothetical protein
VREILRGCGCLQQEGLELSQMTRPVKGPMRVPAAGRTESECPTKSRNGPPLAGDDKDPPDRVNQNPSSGLVSG